MCWNSLQSKRHFPTWQLTHSSSWEIAIQIQMKTLMHKMLKWKYKNLCTCINRNTNTHNMCHWIPCRTTGTSQVTSTLEDKTVLIRLQIQMQIPIWSWIQEQYKFDFIQMVSLILCRNTGTCRVTPLLETQQYKHKLQIQIQIHLKLCS